MKKKLLSMLLVSSMVAGILSGCGTSDESGKKVLNIWCWNDEFQSRFNDYYPEVETVAKDKSTTTL